MLFTSLLTAAVFAQCTKVTTRYEIHSMPQEHIKTYRDTIREALRRPDPQNPGLSIWEAAASFHSTVSDDIHNSPAFFFWHRLFLWSVEQKLQAINPDFYFPYWDSSREWNTYQNSIALKITDMSDTSLKLDRAFSNGQIPASEIYANHFQTSVKTRQGFGYYYGAVEVVHGYLHNAIGGQMATMSSPRDPLFYSHHGNLDCEWSKCQRAWVQNNLPQFAGYVKNAPVTANTAIPFFKNKFGDVVDMSQLCVVYAPYGTKPPAAPKPSEPANVVTTTAANVAIPTSSAENAAATATAPPPAVTEAVGTATNQRTRSRRPAVTTASNNVATTAASAAAAVTTETDATPTNVPPPPPPKVDQCPPPLPESWIVMNKLNRTQIELTAAACKKVVEDVAKGVTFTPPPTYKPEEYKEVIQAVLPKDYVITPPSNPEYTVISSGVRSGMYLGFAAIVISLLG